ncbi:hypothetical protein [Geosporobacter ferrireducens]|uniref:hypothetical protein n=1 Tax=Geosporobacter ferrireducens TaxID=1424294 RepID=UPI00139D8C34|nr:hypothetical protein [Geosporobacter ferrireducens]MTI56399.1 hypothetical protein [Geosporobacter ferrireducens]
MNDFLPIPYEDLTLSEQEMSIAQWNNPGNKRILLFLLPVFFLWFMKNRGLQPFSQEIEKPPLRSRPPALPRPQIEPAASQGLDPALLDRLTLMLDSIKKVNSISGIMKNMPRAGDSPNKLNLGIIKEFVDVFSNHLGEEQKTQFKNIANIMTMVEKAKEVKSKMDEQKKLSADQGGDYTDQIANLLEVIKPILPDEQAKNIDNIQKMAQMMKIMNVFDAHQSEENDAEKEDVKENDFEEDEA